MNSAYQRLGMLGRQGVWDCKEWQPQIFPNCALKNHEIASVSNQRAP